MGLTFELLAVAVLILLNGFFAAAEIAVLSARKPRLQALADEGHRGAAAALRLKADLERFLATVQVGVTLVATLASAFGGAAASARLEPVFAARPALRPIAEPLAVFIVVIPIAYLSLVIGELVPKSLAVRHAERLALWMASPIERLAHWSRAVVTFLTRSTRGLLRLLGQPADDVVEANPFHALEDIRALAEEARESGVLEPVIHGAIAFQDREVREVVTPRSRVVVIPAGARIEQAARICIESRHSRFPVVQGDLDDIVGVVYARDVYEALLDHKAEEVTPLVREALLVPETKHASALLQQMRHERLHIAVVVDEHGSVAGIVTLEDLVEVIIGEIRDEDDVREPRVKALTDGAYEVDGSLPIHELNGEHGFDLPEAPDYVTLAGLILDRLAELPKPGDTVTVGGSRLTVLALEGRRVARVRVAPVHEAELVGRQSS